MASASEALRKKSGSCRGPIIGDVFESCFFHMVLHIVKLTCFRVTFKLIFVRRYITNEPV